MCVPVFVCVLLCVFVFVCSVSVVPCFVLCLYMYGMCCCYVFVCLVRMYLFLLFGCVSWVAAVAFACVWVGVCSMLQMCCVLYVFDVGCLFFLYRLCLCVLCVNACFILRCYCCNVLCWFVFVLSLLFLCVRMWLHVIMC